VTTHEQRHATAAPGATDGTGRSQHGRIPRRFTPVLFGFVLSGLNTLIVTAITTYRNLGLHHAFATHWLTAYASAWPITFPTATIIAPWVRRLVDRLVAPSASPQMSQSTHHPRTKDQVST